MMKQIETSKQTQERISNQIEKLGIGCHLLPNCGLVAIAYVTGKQLSEVSQYYKTTYEKRGNWKGGTNAYNRRAILTHYGVDFAKIDFPKLSLKWWVHNESEPNKQYMVKTSGHVQVIENGMVLDQRGCKPISEYWGKMKRVQEVLQIIP